MDTKQQKNAIETGWLSQCPYFHTIGRSRGLNDFEIDDLCQDIAMRCLLSIDKVDWTRPQDMRDALIRKIARWQLKDHCKKSMRRYTKQEPCFDIHDLEAKADNPSTNIEREEESLCLFTKVDQLGSRASAVLRKRYIEGQSDSDIAVLNHEPVNTIRTRRKRALKKLARIL